MTHILNQQFPNGRGRFLFQSLLIEFLVSLEGFPGIDNQELHSGLCPQEVGKRRYSGTDSLG